MIKSTLNIEGMACNMCEAHIQDAIRKNFDIKSVKANFRKNIAEVVSENELDETRLREVIDATGYEYKGMKKEPYQKKGLFSLFG